MRLQGLLQPLQENDKFITTINSIKNKDIIIVISISLFVIFLVLKYLQFTIALSRII